MWVHEGAQSCRPAVPFGKTAVRAATLAAVCLLFAVPGSAQNRTLSDEEMQLLTEGLELDEGGDDEPIPVAAPTSIRVADNIQIELAFILDVALAWFSGEPAQTGAHDPSRIGFNLQQLELNVRSSVDPYFRFDANIVFSLFGVELEEAYVTTVAAPAGLQFRVGQFLTRFGRLNATHPHAWSFADQPLVHGKFFGSENSRGLGLEASWLTPLPWFVEIGASANNADGECCARSFFGGEDLGINGVGDFLYTVFAKQFFELGGPWSLFQGASAQFGPNPTGQDNRSAIYGLDLYLRYKPTDSPRGAAFSWQSEFLYRNRQLPHERLSDWGLYSQLVWNISRFWEVGGRHEAVSGVDGDPLDPDWSALRHRTSLQVTWRPSHFSRIRLQGARDQRGGADSADWSAFAAFEVLVGAHGAHSY